MQDSSPRSPLLLVAPHRAMFLAGGIQCLAAMLPWAVEMLARASGGGLDWPWPSAWIHALLALYGVFPFFVFGFLLTAMPRWQSFGDLPPQRYAWPWRLLVAGWLLVYAGLLAPAVLLPGLLLVAAGWLWLCAALWPVARRATARLHALPTWLGLLAGAAGMLCWSALAATGDGRWALWAIELGVWGFLLPVFLTVCHRMLPFFSQSVLPGYAMYRPRWALFVLLAGSIVHGALALAGVPAWLWLADLPMALVALHLALRWQFRRSFAVRLLAMLHLGFAWFCLAMLLFAVRGLAAALGADLLGRAPLHALVIGMFAVLALGMVSRVTLGHSGRQLVADTLTWRMCWALQVVATLRVAAELLPVAQPALLVAAVVLWLGVFAAWALRYLPVYWRPRVDGRAG